MATVPAFRNVSTIIGEDGIERVTDFQLIECSIVLPPPSETPPEPELPSSVCPNCGDLDVNISDGVMTCGECGSHGTFGISVEAQDWSDVMEWLGQPAEPGYIMTHSYPDISNPCGEITNLKISNKTIGPIKKYKDIVGDIRNRFDILDL
jgi:hypothetical protein